MVIFNVNSFLIISFHVKLFPGNGYFNKGLGISHKNEFDKMKTNADPKTFHVPGCCVSILVRYDVMFICINSTLTFSVTALRCEYVIIVVKINSYIFHIDLMKNTSEESDWRNAVISKLLMKENKYSQSIRLIPFATITRNVADMHVCR